MTTVSKHRYENPLSIKEHLLDKIGKKSHYYVMPIYLTKDNICTQCLYPRESEVHI